MAGSDVKAIRLEDTGSAGVGPARIRQVQSLQDAYRHVYFEVFYDQESASQLLQKITGKGGFWTQVGVHAAWYC